MANPIVTGQCHMPLPLLLIVMKDALATCFPPLPADPGPHADPGKIAGGQNS